MISLIRAVVFRRWGRYLLAVMFLVGAILVGVMAFANTTYYTKTETLSDAAAIVDKDSGAYQYSELTFSGDPATYQLTESDFSPKLTDDAWVKAGTVDFSYSKPLTGDPQIVAITLRDEQDANPVKYVTHMYTNPVEERNNYFLGSGLCVLLAILLFAAGRFLPVVTVRRKAAPAPVGVAVGSQGAPPSERH